MTQRGKNYMVSTAAAGFSRTFSSPECLRLEDLQQRARYDTKSTCHRWVWRHRLEMNAEKERKTWTYYWESSRWSTISVDDLIHLTGSVLLQKGLVEQHGPGCGSLLLQAEDQVPEVDPGNALTGLPDWGCGGWGRTGRWSRGARRRLKGNMERID